MKSDRLSHLSSYELFGLVKLLDKYLLKRQEEQAGKSWKNSEYIAIFYFVRQDNNWMIENYSVERTQIVGRKKLKPDASHYIRIIQLKWHSYCSNFH